jgi:hypothetical protein
LKSIVYHAVLVGRGQFAILVHYGSIWVQFTNLTKNCEKSACTATLTIKIHLLGIYSSICS